MATGVAPEVVLVPPGHSTSRAVHARLSDAARPCPAGCWLPAAKFSLFSAPEISLLQTDSSPLAELTAESGWPGPTCGLLASASSSLKWAVSYYKQRLFLPLLDTAFPSSPQAQSLCVRVGPIAGHRVVTCVLYVGLHKCVLWLPARGRIRLVNCAGPHLVSVFKYVSGRRSCVLAHVLIYSP